MKSGDASQLRVLVGRASIVAQGLRKFPPAKKRKHHPFT